MRKYSILFLSALTLSSFSLLFSSCKDDDEPTKYQLSFSQSTMTVNEADGTIEIGLQLDKPAPEDITINYALDGTAYDEIRADANEEAADYFVDGDYEEIEIKEGETSAVISLVLYSDDFVEDDETISITITEVDEENTEFEDGSKVEITLTQEDGVLVYLEWPVASTTGVADMDFLVRIGETAPNPAWDGILTGSVYRGFEYNYEFVFLPKAFSGETFGLGYTNTTYGLTFTYYDGSLDPLNFTVTFIEFLNGEFEPEAEQQSFEQSYTLANLNKWVSTSPPTIIAQTFVSNNGVFSDISAIIKQETSSRIGSGSVNQVLDWTQSKPKISKTLKFKELPQKVKDKLGRKLN